MNLSSPLTVLYNRETRVEARAVWMDFRLEGARRIVNLLTFMLRSLKAERCDFGGKIAPALEPFSKQGFHPCLSIIKNSQRRTQIHSKSLKKPLLRQKDDYTPQVR